jgi:hypothetical protein
VVEDPSKRLYSALTLASWLEHDTWPEIADNMDPMTVQMQAEKAVVDI